MKTEPTAYAFPGSGEDAQGSLTIREYFAAKIMAGLVVHNLSPTEIHMSGEALRVGIAVSAVELADALIIALNAPVDKSVYSKLIDAAKDLSSNVQAYVGSERWDGHIAAKYRACVEAIKNAEKS